MLGVVSGARVLWVLTLGLWTLDLGLTIYLFRIQTKIEPRGIVASPHSIEIEMVRIYFTSIEYFRNIVKSGYFFMIDITTIN